MDAVDWTTIRAAFVSARGKRTQEQIAAGARLRQNAISKLESNANLGPAVETFVKAVEGLGLPVSTFFAQIEGAEQPQVADHESLTPLASDLGMAQAAIYRLTQRISTLERRLEAHTRVRKADDRPASAARAQAAERSAARRDGRPRNARRKDKGKGKGQ